MPPVPRWSFLLRDARGAAVHSSADVRMLCEDPRLRQARTGLVVPRAVAEAHTRIVAKQRRAVPFSQAVQEVKATPLASSAFDLHGPGGRGYRLIERDSSAVRAREIGTAGAMLGWDACG